MVNVLAVSCFPVTKNVAKRFLYTDPGIQVNVLRQTPTHDFMSLVKQFSKLTAHQRCSGAVLEE